MDETKLRAWWAHRQGLDGMLAGESAAAVLARSGWARSVAGINPYLTLYSRAGISREAADAAVARLEIHELPAARNCTYVVPAQDFALALKAGQPFLAGDENVGRKLGVTDKEVERLCAAVEKALAGGPLDPDGIRAQVGAAARSLGEEGKKKGMSTTLPLALGRMQAEGRIRRVPINGRLDQQRYRYTLWKPNPLEKFKLSVDEACTELARRFFSWIGPATAAEFQTFAGLGVKAAKAAIEPLGLVPLEEGDTRLMLPQDCAAFRDFKPPKAAQYVLVSSLDTIALLRHNVKDLAAPAELERRLVTGGAVLDLPNHAILDRGRLVGLWEYDTATESIVWASFGLEDKALKEAVARTEKYVREELGDARSFSLDSPKTRGPRIEALRKAAGAA